jgi:MFS family permease
MIRHSGRTRSDAQEDRTMAPLQDTVGALPIGTEMTLDAVSSAPATDQPYPPARIGWFTVFALLVMFMLSFTDRQIIALMVGPLQADLGLSDIQIGLLQGFAFSCFYVVAGLFIGWAMDHHSRRMLIMCGVIVWSISCAMGGLASGFWMLFLARVGVGMGEGALSPGAPSMLSDVFPRDKLTFPLGIFTVGANLGIAISFSLGGLVMGSLAHGGGVTLPLFGALHAWQATFLLLGIPGVFIALLMLAVPEPVRRGRTSDGAAFLPPLLKLLASRPRLFVSHFLGFGLSIMSGYALLSWLPALLTRRFDWPPSSIGPVLGLILGGGGIVGCMGASFLADWLFRRQVYDVHFRLQAAGMAVMAAAAATIPFATSPWAILAASGVIYVMASSAVPLSMAAVQLVAPNEVRGRASAAFSFFSTVLGLGLGPLLVATLTEHVFHDRLAVGSSISIVVGFAALGCLILMLFGRTGYRDAVVEMNARFGAVADA